MKYAFLLASTVLLWAPAVRAEDALVTAQNAYFAAWDAAPMAVAYATFVTEKPAGYGLYMMRADGVYKNGDTIMTYLEPVGFGFKTNADSASTTFGFTIDLSITDASGAVVVTQDNFSKNDFSARLPLHEVYLLLNLEIGAGSPFPAGDYVLTYTLHDQNSTETAPVSIPFTISG